MHNQTQLIQKNMVHFSKTGPAVYHSHHDLIRFWERAVRRAELPMRLTQGFNPRPRMVFPQAIGVGISSRHEAIVLELCARMEKADLRDRLVGACGDTLGILEVETLPPVKKSPQVVASSYLITGWPEAAPPSLAATAASIMAMAEIAVERGATGEKRRIDIRPHITGIRAEPEGLALELAHSQAGSARPDEIAALAAGMLGIDWHDLEITKTGMTLER